jgi:membrane-associated protease RseP (regulator of RpoE activity)
VEILLYVLAIIVIILIHEAGHFFTAKAFKIKVQEFFVGFGPRLWSIRRGETEYGVKALPFGGYVRIAGMNPFEEIPPEDIPRTFHAKPIWQRAVVIATGPFTHFVMAVIFGALFFAAIGVPSTFRPAIDGIETALNGRPSPAARVGLRPGDVILAVNGHPIGASEDPEAGVDRVIAETRANVGEPITLLIERDGRRMLFRVYPVLSKVEGEPEPVGRIGAVLSSMALANERSNPIEAIRQGAVLTWDVGKLVVTRLDDVFGPSGVRRIWDLLAGSAERNPGDVQSVVGGGRTLVQAAETQGLWTALLTLLVELNIFIGILNLIPLPPLDGGHLAVLAYEKVRGRRPDARKLIPITALVAAYLIMFALSITYLDIVNPVPNQFR